MNKKLIILILLPLMLLSCGRQQAGQKEDPVYGKYENNRYSNSRFGLSVQVPVGWEYIEKRSNDEIRSELRFTSDDPRRGVAEISSDDIRTATLLYVKASDTYGNLDIPNLQIVAENLDGTGITDGSQYVANVLRMTDRLGYSGDGYDHQIIMSHINERDFYSTYLAVERRGASVFQKLYVTLKDGFALTYILTYLNRGQLSELESIVDNIKIDRT